MHTYFADFKSGLRKSYILMEHASTFSRCNGKIYAPVSRDTKEINGWQGKVKRKNDTGS